jgi:hypothetical protein
MIVGTTARSIDYIPRRKLETGFHCKEKFHTDVNLVIYMGKQQ